MTYNNLLRVILLFLFSGGQLLGQTVYLLEEALHDAMAHAPSAGIGNLTAREKELKEKNLNTRYLPQINVAGQVTYQSETTGLDVSFPGVSIPRLSRDQYKVQADVMQSLYDGGLVRAQKIIAGTAAAIESAQADAELETIREQVIQFYFGMLEAESGLEVLELKRKDLEAVRKKIEVAVANGAALKSDLRRIDAEAVTLDQRQGEIRAFRITLLQNLSIVTGKNLDADTRLSAPPTRTPGVENISQRPGNRILVLQEMQLDHTRKADLALNRPKLQLFGQAGYGKPGLNFLKNEFAAYYLGGLRLQWNLGSLYTRDRDGEISDIQKEKVRLRRQNFDRQAKIRLAGLSVDIERLKEVVAGDDRIIDLRKEIRQSAAVQFENGARTAADYLDVINDENEAILSREIHRIQQLKAVYMYDLVSGVGY